MRNGLRSPRPPVQNAQPANRPPEREPLFLFRHRLLIEFYDSLLGPAPSSSSVGGIYLSVPASQPALCESRFHLINFRFLHISSRSAAAKSEFARFPIRSRQRHKTATTADDAGLDFFTIPLLDVTALCGLLFLALMVSSFLPREESHVTFDPDSCKCNIAFMSIFCMPRSLSL